MSHELRTPLNAVLGYTELILDDIFGEVPPPIREMLERVKTNGQHLLGLINDVLDLSKIEAGQLTLSLGDYAMGEVVHAVVSARGVARRREEARLQGDRPARPAARPRRRAAADPGAAEPGRQRHQVHRHRQVAIEARRVRRRLPSCRCRIPARASPRPTSRRSSRSSSRPTAPAPGRRAGTGLGLSISRRIVELHGGRLWVESTLGRGIDVLFHGAASRWSGRRSGHEQAHPGHRGSRGEPAHPGRSARQRGLSR